METRKVKKLGLVGSGAMVAVMAVGSAAFACSVQIGKLTITGLNGTTVNGTTGSQTYYGNGGEFGSSGTPHFNGYCGGPPTSRTDVDTVNTDLPGLPDFRLKVDPYDCPSGQLSGTSLPNPQTNVALNDLWEVRLVKAEAAIDFSDPKPTCHLDVDAEETTTANPTSRWVVIGTMTINNGSGSGEYVLPSEMVGPANLCIDKTGVGAFWQGSGFNAPPVAFLNLI